MDIKEPNEKRLLKKMSYEDIAEFTGYKTRGWKALLLEQRKSIPIRGITGNGTGYFVSGDRMPFAYN